MMSLIAKYGHFGGHKLLRDQNIIGILLLVFYSKANCGPLAKLHADLQF